MGNILHSQRTIIELTQYTGSILEVRSEPVNLRIAAEMKLCIFLGWFVLGEFHSYASSHSDRFPS